MFKQLAIAIGITVASSGAFFGYNHYFTEAEVQAQRGDIPQLVKVSSVNEQLVKDIIKSVGTVSASEKIAIAPKVNGYISTILVKNGESVKKGAVILSIDSTQAKSELDSAMTSLQDAELKNARFQSLMSNNAVSESDVSDSETTLAIAQANVEIAQQNLEDHTIKASIDGIIDIDELSTGEFLSSGQSVGELKNENIVNVRFFIPQNQAHKVAKDQKVRVLSGSNKDYSTEGEVIDIATSVNPDNRMLRVKARLKNENKALITGESVTIDLITGEREALVVNEESLLMKGSKRYVFEVNDKKATQVEVKTGVRTEGQVEIVEGVDLDSLIVMEGQDRLTSGDTIQVVDQKKEDQ